AQPPDHRQHLQRVHDAGRHLRRHQLVDLFRKIVERFHAERQAHALDRPVDVRRHRDVAARRLLEQQRRAAAGQLAHAIGDGGYLEIRTHWLGDAREELPLVEVGDEVVEIRVQIFFFVSFVFSCLSWLLGRYIAARILSVIASATSSARRPASPVTTGARRETTAPTKSSSSRFSGSSFETSSSPPWIEGRPWAASTSRHISTFCAA